MAKVQNVLRLLERLSEKFQVEMDYTGFAKMAEPFDPDVISKKYLDETYRLVRKRIDADESTIGSRVKKLNVIAVELGYKSFHHFENELERPLEPILMNCIGLWWSLVRSNVGKSIYKAPVKIINDPNEGAFLTLKGQENLFRGKVKASAGCLFCELHSEKEKKLYIVMKGSVNSNTHVLQGTFAGISSTGDPIGGREVFMRETKLEFKDMKWNKIPVDDNTLDEKIKAFFERAEGNCIKVDNLVDLG